MVERERRSHRNQLRRGETQNTQKEAEKAQGWANTKTKGKAAQSLSKAGPHAQIWGGVSKRAELALSSTNRGRGEINESPQILGATPKATQPAKAAAWKQQIC